MRILVTGGAGFIGSYLSKELSKNHEVIVFDNLYRGKVENLPENVEFIKGDIRNLGDLNKIPKVEVVYHLAAQVSVNFSVLNPQLDEEINKFGTKNLVEWCRKKEVRRIIYFSTAAVYGNPSYLPIDENHPTKPLSPYGKSKLAGENYILSYPSSFILRIANVYGKGGVKEGEAGVIHIFAEKLKNNESLEIFGDGTQTRDFINIRDLVNAAISLLDYKGKERIFNIGSGKETSINKLVEIFKKFNPNLKVKYLPKREGDIYRSFFDISRAKKELNYLPKVKLEEGIKELLEVF